MRLIDLNTHLENYKNKYWNRGWSSLRPYHNRALQIEDFIQSLPERLENEPLTEKELYELVVLIKDMDEDLNLVLSIKNDLKNEACFTKTYNLLLILEPLDLSNENLIYYLNEITDFQIKALEKLSMMDTDIDIVLISYLVTIENNQALNTLLDFFISIDFQLEPEHIKSMAELDRENKLELNALFDTFKDLNLSSTLKSQLSIDDFPRLLNALTQDLIELKEAINKSFGPDHLISEKMILSFFNNALNSIGSIIRLSMINQLIDESFSLIENHMNYDSLFYFNLENFMKVLNSKNMLTPENYQTFFEIACMIDGAESYSPFKKAHSKTAKTLLYLAQESGPLTSDTLLTLAKQIENFDLFETLNLFTINKFMPSLNQFDEILSMPYNDLRRLHGMLRNPIKASRLDEKMLDRCISIVDFKLEPAQMFSPKYEKNSNNLEIRINNELTLFRQEDAKKESGSFGAVTRAFDGESHFFAVKTFKFCPKMDLEKEAAREAKRNQLLGRYTAYSENGVLIYPWQYDKTVTQFTKEELKGSSYIDRMECLAHVLNELTTLHDNYQLHGDIKGPNCSLSLTNKTMNLIDFGSSRKFGVSQHKNGRKFLFTMVYSDQLQKEYDFCDDIYSLGVVFTLVFPELYDIKDIEKHRKIIPFQIKEPETPIEKAICLLIDNMTSDCRAQRCLAEDALNYCNELFFSQGEISYDQLEDLFAENISRESATDEDLIRNRMWEASF